MATHNSETTMTNSRTDDLPENATEFGLGFRDDTEGDCTGLAVAGDRPMPSDGSSAALHEGPTDPDEERKRPQLDRNVDIPKDFDYRELKPRRYGNILPPLTEVERQSLKTSIVDHGFIGRILIDEWLYIIDGNTRHDICLELGIAPAVEMFKGLGEEEKEELALSCNLDRRQLKDPDVERQVLEARFENMFKLREKDPKKYTQRSIADALGVSLATVSLRERIRHDSCGENVSKPDARRSYDEDIEIEAVRLVKEGITQAEVARKLLMHPKAVQRAVNKVKKRDSGTGAAKDGKSKKVSADSSGGLPHATGFTLPNDGIPRIHRLAFESLGQDPQDYAGRLEACLADAREAVEAASADVDKLLKLTLYGSRLAAAADLRLRQILAGGADEAGEIPSNDQRPETNPYEVGTVHQGSVLSVAPDGFYVALPDGVGGVIDIGDMSLTLNAKPEENESVRVRVKGFDSERGLLDLRLLGRQSSTRTDTATAVAPNMDERFTPQDELSGHKAGPQEKEVI